MYILTPDQKYTHFIENKVIKGFTALRKFKQI